MSLYNSIKGIQKNFEKIYLVIEKRFSGNIAIKDLWSNMARDVSQQIESLQELPRSFWIHLKKEQETLLKSIKTEVKLQDFDNEDLSLSECIEYAIRSEEAMILKIYVPLIRNLRKNWSGRELDFYIMVKAHIVRFRRVAESFSGDPAVQKQAMLLLQKFEKEVQEPEVDIQQLLKPSRRARARIKASKAVKRSATGKTVKPKSKTAELKPVKPKVTAVKSKPKSTKLKATTVKSKPKPKATKPKAAAVKLKPKSTKSKSAKPKPAKPRAAKPKAATSKTKAKLKTDRKQNRSSVSRTAKSSTPSRVSRNKPPSGRKRVRR